MRLQLILVGKRLSGDHSFCREKCRDRSTPVDDALEFKHTGMRCDHCFDEWQAETRSRVFPFEPIVDLSKRLEGGWNIVWG